MTSLGPLFEARDPQAAREWYENGAAAGVGDTRAMLSRGRLLEDSDPEAAREWYEQAAAAGNTSAMVNLAAMLHATDAPPRVFEPCSSRSSSGSGSSAS